MRTIATFKSDSFNKAEPKDYFINECCYGDDLAKWLILRLREGGIKTEDEPGQEDFGWYFNFEVQAGKHSCIMGFRPGDDRGAVLPPPFGRQLRLAERQRGKLEHARPESKRRHLLGLLGGRLVRGKIQTHS